MSHLFGLTPGQQAALTVQQWDRYRKFSDGWMKERDG